MSVGWLHPLYRRRSRRLRAWILALARRFEGGEYESLTLRRIFRDYHGIEVGLYSYGCFVPDSIPAGTRVGRYCSFARGVVVFNANHPLDRVALHPAFYNPSLGVVPAETIERGRIEIGHDVWVGRNALVTPRVARIGNGAIVGAGAVVTKDVPSYAVVGGNPARILRYRFPEDVQARIDASRWWERSLTELKACLPLFLEPAERVVLSSEFSRAFEDGRT